jgi:hypothetical protein
MSSRDKIELKKEAPKSRRFSLISTLITCILIFLVLGVGAELLARTNWAENVFPLRSVGNYHTQFEIKWFKLEKFVKENGGVDVIVMGNSMVNTGVDPEILESEYESRTGQKLRIFNFGVEGLTVAPDKLIAQILIQQYHPVTLLYFTEMRDYIKANGIEESKKFLDSDWINYQLGSRSAKGWLIDNSQFLQTVLPFRFWLTPDFIDTYLLDSRRVKNTSLSGYEPDTRNRQDIDVRPDPNNDQDKALFSLYGNFQIDPTRENDLKTIMDSPVTQVLVSEIPIYFTFYDYFGGETVHNSYLEDISEFITQNNGVFIQPIDPDLIPLDGRADRVHLNQMGAQFYSKLLANQLADLCEQRSICMGQP